MEIRGVTRRTQFSVQATDLAFLDSLGGPRAEAVRKCLQAASAYDAGDLADGKDSALRRLAAKCRMSRGLKRQQEGGAALVVWPQWVRPADLRMLEALMARRGFRARSEALRYAIRVVERFKC